MTINDRADSGVIQRTDMSELGGASCPHDDRSSIFNALAGTRCAQRLF